MEALRAGDPHRIGDRPPSGPVPGRCAVPGRLPLARRRGASALAVAPGLAAAPGLDAVVRVAGPAGVLHALPLAVDVAGLGVEAVLLHVLRPAAAPDLQVGAGDRAGARVRALDGGHAVL